MLKFLALLGALICASCSMAPAFAQDAARPEAMHAIRFASSFDAGKVIVPLRKRAIEMRQHHRLAAFHARAAQARGFSLHASGNVLGLIERYVSARLGAGWVGTAKLIARIESGGRCNAYNHGAIGVFQVRHPEQFGISARSAMTCDGGVRAGVAHMASCLARGATTSARMMRCHNSGSPFGRVEAVYRHVLSRL